MQDNWKCRKCGCDLELKKVVLEYIGNHFSHELPCCPQCGQIFVSAELAEGKMAEVETLYEDK